MNNNPRAGGKTAKAMTAGFEEVTPEDARHYLATVREGNRAVINIHAEALARDMAEGRWNWDSPEGLVFDTEGHLADGANRLTAIAANGEPVRMWVTRNAPAGTFGTLNTGVSRTLANRLHAEGHANATTLAAVGRQAVSWELGKPWTRGSVKPTREEVTDIIGRHPDLAEAAQMAAVTWPRQRRVTLSTSQAGFAWWVLRQIDKDEADYFMTALRDGTGLEAGDPILALRERLAGMGGSRTARWVQGADRPQARLLLTFLAWRFHLRRQQVRKIQLPTRITDDTFYDVLGLPGPRQG